MKETSADAPGDDAVGFDEQAFDEVQHAEAVARQLGSELHEVTASRRSAALLPKLAWHFDEPFADSSAVPTYYVSEAARERVTVALSGDGGDELWGWLCAAPGRALEQRARASLGPARHVARPGSAARCRCR